MFGASFNIISQALEVYKKMIDVKNRNIANAQEENYVAEEPVVQSDLYSGITFQEVRRIQNFNFINTRNEKLSYVSYLEERRDYLSKLESVFQELSQGNGLIDYVNRFFQSYQELMKEPTNEGAKSQFLESAKMLVKTIKSRYGELTRSYNEIDYTINDYVRKVNELVKKIYKINKEIFFKYAQTKVRGEDYKTLLDQRDKYLKELSQYINVRAQEDELGRIKVYTSKGFVLVDFSENFFTLKYEGGKLIYEKDESDITNVVESGQIKGLIDAKGDIENLINKLDNLRDYLVNNVKIPVNGGGEASVFSGASINDFEVDANLETNLGNLDFSRTQDYAQNALTWWEEAKGRTKDITNYVATQKNALDSEYEVEKALYDSLEKKILERQGVSIDQEFMEIMQIQKNYEAVAKILPRIDEMFRTLLNMV
ncbi:flagellar hook-associated protein FlgK [Aquifex aeolicus]|uniref:Flagellar hook-associated protein 1 n=1 Tax=Aquifex aeolicus (strain VF5) TaxID=224324 RepID=O67578_AQUAE|nr:flagellar hook-associated protein FlgK [Aquifex aeolicus]AAC07523.1 flagellar hook associated protein FlgK [Aquifex aeolicus VF5]